MLSVLCNKDACIRFNKFESPHEIMAHFILHKLILQTSMRSHPVGLDFWFSVRPFIYFHRSCVQTAKPSLVTYVISTIISWAGSISFHLIFWNTWISHIALTYGNDPKFLDRYAWANSADPGQTAPRSSLIRVYTVCHSVCIIWTHYSMVEPHSSNFRVITTNVWVSEYLGNYRYTHCHIMKESYSCFVALMENIITIIHSLKHFIYSKCVVVPGWDVRWCDACQTECWLCYCLCVSDSAKILYKVERN